MHPGIVNLDNPTAGPLLLMFDSSDLHNLLLDQSLQFHFEGGSVTQVRTGQVAAWRSMPTANVAYVWGGRWRVEREDIGEYYIESGEAGFIPAVVRHRSFMVAEGHSESRWAHFRVLLCGHIDLFSFFDMPHILRGAAAERMGEILARLAHSGEGTDPFSFLLNRKILEFELAAVLVGAAKPKFDTGLRLQNIRRVLPVLAAIEADLAAEHSRESMAKLAHLSPSRFATVFKEAVGMAPGDYLTKLRMQRAQLLLADGDLSIEQVAAQAGYRDAFYFSRLFKGHFGTSPRGYRGLLGK
jgi:AraC-like DNA-binding protein